MPNLCTESPGVVKLRIIKGQGVRFRHADVQAVDQRWHPWSQRAQRAMSTCERVAGEHYNAAERHVVRTW